MKLKPLEEITVFDLNKGDKIMYWHGQVRITGTISSVRETANEWIDAFVIWPNAETEVKLNMYGKNLYLIKGE